MAKMGLSTRLALLAFLMSRSVASGQPCGAADPALPIPFSAFVAALESKTTDANPVGPQIESVSPMIGHAGDIVTITGRRLTGAVAIFHELAARTLAASDTEMTVQVPPSTTGPVVIRTPNGQVRTANAFVYVFKVEDGVLFPVPVGGGDWFPASLFANFSPLQNVDDTAKFLQRHWVQPLPPQGDPPESFSLLESSTSPRQCKACHQPQFDLWKESFHARTASKLVRWNARVRGMTFEQPMQRVAQKLKQDDLSDVERAEARKQLRALAQARNEQENSCRRCHDPVAENGPWTEVELSRAPEDPKQRPTRDGVQCVVCHVRSHQRFGPPALPGTRPKPIPPADGEPQPPPAHNSFTASQAYEDSRFCAGCHTFTIRVDKGIVGNPFEEWRTSRFASEGVSCQKCHMPGRKHQFRGIHDREMTLSGLTISLELEEGGGLVKATAKIESTRVGHMFPTYSIPMVHVRMYRSVPQVTQKMPEGGLLIKEYAIGRQLDLGRLVEEWDHRIAPGGAVVMGQRFPPQAGENVTLHIDVVPRDDYERSLRQQLAAAENDPAHAYEDKIRDLLKHEESLRYRLIDITLPVPKPGATVRKTMKEGVWQ